MTSFLIIVVLVLEWVKYRKNLIIVKRTITFVIVQIINVLLKKKRRHSSPFPDY